MEKDNVWGRGGCCEERVRKEIEQEREKQGKKRPKKMKVGMIVTGSVIETRCGLVWVSNGLTGWADRLHKLPVS